MFIESKKRKRTNVLNKNKKILKSLHLIRNTKLKRYPNTILRCFDGAINASLVNWFLRSLYIIATFRMQLVIIVYIINYILKTRKKSGYFYHAKSFIVLT